jgi:putative hydrolase of HD superfamily
MMDTDALVDFFLEAATLKRVPRSGWQVRGVPHVESVAEHSFGVGLMALALADAVEAETPARTLDLEKVLVMALLHDLAEVRLTDLPVSAQRLIPLAIKSEAEASAMEDLLAPLPKAERWAALWLEYEERTGPEAQLVRDVDKLEMMVQCLRYEQAGSQGLDEFWQATDRREWYHPLCAELYARLKELRP